MPSFTVKVQRTLRTTHAAPRVLIYTRDRAVEYEGELTPELAQLFEPHEFKLYFKAHLNRDGKIILDREVPAQPW